jgi:hypothetical protein|tara:strand:- start:166 stop:411 length:246 start_codon:yes stop_codon:yes gene_type:complete
MSKKEVIQEESLFKNLNLSDKREENESREDYIKRRKRNKRVLKLYMTYGRDIFKQIFPDGITNTSIEALLNQSKFDEKANA